MYRKFLLMQKMSYLSIKKQLQINDITNFLFSLPFFTIETGDPMKKILIVEDIPDNAELVRRILLARGYEVFHAADAESGLEMALSEKPDLILLDLGLPDHDGLTLAGWIRADAAISKIPIVAYTAWPPE